MSIQFSHMLVFFTCY